MEKKFKISVAVLIIGGELGILSRFLFFLKPLALPMIIFGAVATVVYGLHWKLELDNSNNKSEI